MGSFPGFIFTESSFPNGLSGIFPCFKYQRRLKTSSGSGCEDAPIAAGCNPPKALTIDSAIPVTNCCRLLPFFGPQDGPVCVWVEETSIFSTGSPVLPAAILFASSSKSGPSPRLSTTTSASVVVPSSKTSARACNGSCALVAIFPAKPPGIFWGNSVGVISTTAAPARSWRAAIGAETAQTGTIKQHVNRSDKDFIRGGTTVGWPTIAALPSGRKLKNLLLCIPAPPRDKPFPRNFKVQAESNVLRLHATCRRMSDAAHFTKNRHPRLTIPPKVTRGCPPKTARYAEARRHHPRCA